MLWLLLLPLSLLSLLHGDDPSDINMLLLDATSTSIITE